MGAIVSVSRAVNTPLSSIVPTKKSILVLWARLELARLAPLPPQDSVSTNSTTRADIRFFMRQSY